MFADEGRPINAASILPGLLQSFGDLAEVVAEIRPRKLLVAGGGREQHASIPAGSVQERRFTQDVAVLANWLGE